MKITSLLIAVEIPKEPSEDQKKRITPFLGKIEGILLRKEGFDRLAAGVFVIPLEQKLSIATRILAAADQFELPYKILHIPTDAQWFSSIPPL